MNCWFTKYNSWRKDLLSDVDKRKVGDRMVELATKWTNGEGFENVKKSGWNDNRTFKFLYKKYTHKPDLDPNEFPVNFKDLRKFELGLQYYNSVIAKKRGYFARKFHLPRQAMQNVPELMKFEEDLHNDTQYFRDYSIETGRLVNDVLSTFKDFTASMGATFESLAIKSGISSGGQKEVSRLNAEFDGLLKKLFTSQSKSDLQKIRQDVDANRLKMQSFYQSSSGQAFKILNQVLQGADPESYKQLDAVQISQLNKISKLYQDIRVEGVTGLIRGLQKIKQLAKEKDLRWVDASIDKINGYIKAIEFQAVRDENHNAINHKYMHKESIFQELGFEPDSRFLQVSTKSGKKQVALSRTYMSQYTLGLMKTIKNLEQSVHDRDIDITQELKNEINTWDNIVDIAKGRNPILNPVYDVDPFFFLKKYTSDVGIFNYKTHVKSHFINATQAIVKDHLLPSRKAGSKDLEESALSMIDLLKEVYKEIQHIDPAQERVTTDIMRIMTSVTYFRLMGGNIRSAARNATQRMYEFVQFGGLAKLQAFRFYRSHGQATKNTADLQAQKKKFGLQWFDSNNKASNAWDALTGTRSGIRVSSQSRGALEDAYIMDKSLFVDKNGELSIKDSDRTTASIARFSQGVSQKASFMHRVVEDWNRSKTFGTAYALAAENLSASSDSWKSRKILEKDIDAIMKIKGDEHVVGYKDLVEKYGNKAQEKINSWTINKAGRMAYNSVLDLHFEYAKWNKARAIRPVTQKDPSDPDWNRWYTQWAKLGIGQFAHYRFNMVNLMYKWARDAGLSVRAGDFRSEEVMRAMRFGMLQAILAGATIGLRTNFTKLANNDVLDSGDALWTWMSSKRELFAEGEISKETADELERKTYGQGGFSFFGPNITYLLSLGELALHHDSHENPIINMIFGDAADKTVRTTKNQELYQKIYMFNSQAARSIAYSSSMFTEGGGLKDALWLEAGLFPSKEQREWSRWAYGQKRKSRKKLIKKNMPEAERRRILKALEGI